MQLKLDTEKLTDLFRSFHEITGLRIGVFDRDANELLAFPKTQCDFRSLCGIHLGFWQK